jgi:hypothetical protein
LGENDTNRDMSRGLLRWFIAVNVREELSCDFPINISFQALAVGVFGCALGSEINGALNEELGLIFAGLIPGFVEPREASSPVMKGVMGRQFRVIAKEAEEGLLGSAEEFEKMLSESFG